MALARCLYSAAAFLFLSLTDKREGDELRDGPRDGERERRFAFREGALGEGEGTGEAGRLNTMGDNGASGYGLGVAVGMGRGDKGGLDITDTGDKGGDWSMAMLGSSNGKNTGSEAAEDMGDKEESRE